jgi:hypothetical protein
VCGGPGAVLGRWVVASGRRAAVGAVGRSEEGAVVRSEKRASPERKREEKEMKEKFFGDGGLGGAGQRRCGGEPGRAE